MSKASDDVNPKAAALEAQAAKLADKFDWFGASREKNQQEAAELYTKAAAQYKISKHFFKAGECYEKSAECCMAADNAIEANQAWREAGKAFSKVDSDRAIRAYSHAIEHYKDADRFAQAARLHEEIAKLLEEEDHYEAAISEYEKCADLYETDSDETNANKRYLIIAHLSAKLQDYTRAIELFERVAKAHLENHLLRWNVKGYLFKSFLCILNECAQFDDPKRWAKINDRLERYATLSDTFATSREAKLCTALAECVPAQNIEAYKDAVIKFETIQKLEPWHTDQLLNLEVYITDKMEAPPDPMAMTTAAEDPPDYDDMVPTTLESAASGEKKTDFTEAPDLDLL
jgi:alpha-soluble NSF attachment protein